MARLNRIDVQRTKVNKIFHDLYTEIALLRLMPGEKISEVDIAEKYGVSRQPVRDAFNRLDAIGFLLIRPKRATEVRRFSVRQIEKSRFVRAAIEAAVLRQASAVCDTSGAKALKRSLDDQSSAMETADFKAFSALDYSFHRTLCEIAGLEFAFDVISTEKAKVDRLCVLGLSREDRMPQLLDDHTAIASAVVRGDAETAVNVSTLHLSRLDDTIAAIMQNNSDYFEPDLT
ncbi:GntR family transcriptional regulator [Puniceibacterium sp. IMCC21224]|uniref:GntR family transcriptional regulator n=1 Tax=Puniceibacterium sp. IMCC21224 TaxID=1618204 RepID=UPI00064DE92A|nr:GntR family transcriptional regulator [Puniceibacterium sp. IMCC21224]